MRTTASQPPAGSSGGRGTVGAAAGGAARGATLGAVGGAIAGDTGKSAAIGAGGSDLTWSAYALVGWQFTDWGSLNAGYKWLAYDYETGSGPSRFSWDVTYQGPIAGLVFNW